MKMKKCQQCGILKEETEYRQSYYQSKKGRTDSRYRICKNCESINSRYRTLVGLLEKSDYKDDGLKERHEEEQKQILTLYDELKRRGLQVPMIGMKKEDRLTPAQKALEQVMCMPVEHVITTSSDSIPMTIEAKIDIKAPVVINTPIKPLDIPDDLAYYLGDEWFEHNYDPEYLHEVVYESLKAKYRPMLSFDMVKHEPVFDDTYKATLDEILKKFDDYEDDFDMKEDDQ